MKEEYLKEIKKIDKNKYQNYKINEILLKKNY